MKRLFCLILTAMVPILAANGQQVADTGYAPLIANPAYAPGKGPLVYIDEGHYNFHTKGDRYLPFAKLLERDGYRTEGYGGRVPAEKVDSIYSFTGQAFTIPEDADPVLTFDEKHLLLLSDTAWVFNEKTIFRPINGWSQLAYKEYGKGRVVMSGEAAMFTAQLAGPQQYPAGMNSPFAHDNHRLLLNIIRWLDGRL